jgi:hypothetical protein
MMEMGIVFTGNRVGSIKGVGDTTLLFIGFFIICLMLTPALKAQTKTASTFEIQVEVGEVPHGYGLRSVLLMNPGDMEKLGLKGGERVRACNRGVGVVDGSNCVIVTVEYGAGVVSGTVMMDIDDINSLKLSPGDRFTMGLTPH